MDWNLKRVIISRTDSIGDVMLTLPICAWLKKSFPSIEIIFLGKGYTKSIVESYTKVDRFVDWNDYEGLSQDEQQRTFKALNADAIIHVFPNKAIAKLAKKVKIPVRIGTSHRLFHLFTCTDRINFTRKNSALHEAQLNHELLRPFGLHDLPSLEEIIETTVNFHVNQTELPKILEQESTYTILHPKSQGSAKEWPIEKYIKLADFLVQKGEKVLFTGTQKEGALFKEMLPKHDNIIDTTGLLSLDQLIFVISRSKNLVACSTGPLHIAAYCGVNTIGIYSPKRPIHPGRWKALGKKVQIVVNDENCPSCKKKEDCNCIMDISVEAIASKLE